MAAAVEAPPRGNLLYRRLSHDDRKRLTDVSSVRTYPRGTVIFSEGDDSDFLYAVHDGRVKVVKMLPGGKEVILELVPDLDMAGARGAALATLESLHTRSA